MKYSISVIAIAIVAAISLFGFEAPRTVAQNPPEKKAATKITVEIGGIDKPYVVGDLMKIDAVVTGVDDPSKITYDWKILPEVDFELWPDGSKIMMGTGPKATQYTVFLAVGVLDTNGEKATQELITRIGNASVTEPNTVEQPEPPAKDPEPPAKEPIKLGPFGKKAVELTELVRVNEFYSEQDLKSDALKLAGNFSLIGEQVESGVIPDLTKALDKTRVFNRNFDNRDNWAEWFSGLSLSLEKASNDGELDTATQISKVWNDIAQGLSSL